MTHCKRWGEMKSPLTTIVKISQLNSELSHMKHSQEVSKSDLQAVKIQLGYFFGKFHV